MNSYKFLKYFLTLSIPFLAYLSFNGNGINLYNISDYNSNDHPPVIGISYDGIALFGKHEISFSSMAGSQVSLDEYGGHDHGDGFGYHYHAHTQLTVGTTPPNNSFNQHILLVGAWKGKSTGHWGQRGWILN